MNIWQWWIKRPPIWRVVAGVGLSLGGIVLSMAIPYSWAGWKPSGCWPVCFCEAARQNFVRQPANTLSNLAFIVVGLLIMGRTARESFQPQAGNLMGRIPAYRLTYGLGVLAIGFCSIFYHASLTAAGQWFDWLGIYILFAFIVVYNLTRLVPLPHPIFAVVYGAAVVGLSAFTYYRIDLRLQLFSDLLLLALVLEGLVRLMRRPRIQSFYLLGGLVSLLVARYAAVRMGEGDLCVATSWVQGHAIWHILDELATGLLYLYYASENVFIKYSDSPVGLWTRVKARRP